MKKKGRQSNEKKLTLSQVRTVILTAIMVAFPPTAEPATEKVIVPERVYYGDTLSGVCSRAALRHGDVRDDLRAVMYDTLEHNHIPDVNLIQPGDVILVELEVPAQKCAGKTVTTKSVPSAARFYAVSRFCKYEPYVCPRCTKKYLPKAGKGGKRNAGHYRNYQTSACN